MAWAFRTVPDELVACAEAVAEHYRALGYRISVEPRELGFPNTPTFQAKRANTRLVAEVVDRIDEALLKRWTDYGKSSGKDFRVVVVVPDPVIIVAQADAMLRALGLGCVVASPQGCVERIQPTDLALNVALPELAAMPARARELLGPAYEKFARGDWREGFEDACQAFEAESRRYMKRHSKSGRIRVLRKGVPTALTSTEIDHFTMGRLASVFGEIINQNLADSVIHDTLKSVNQDRIGVVHKKASKAVEARLRRNVGQHMWTLHAGFKEVIG